MMRSVHALALLLVATALHCASLTQSNAETCGNGVIDPGEDCDTFSLTPVTPSSNPATCRAPGTDRACRLDCSTGGTCPAGWGCGLDGICRQPAGKFTRVGSAIAAGGYRLLTGDFDGDGRKEVVARGRLEADGRAKLRVEYFDASAAHAAETVLSSPVASPFIADLSNDGIDDVAFVDIARTGHVGGVGLFLGAHDRSLLPVPYLSASKASEALIIPIFGKATGGLTPLLLAKYDASVSLLALTVPRRTNLLVRNHDEINAPTSLAKRSYDRAPQVSWVPGDATQNPCGKVIFAYTGDTRVSLYAPCLPDGSWNVDKDASGSRNVTFEHVTIPEKIGTGVLVEDIDGDGLIDLIVGGQENGDDAHAVAYVAHGTASGGFEAVAAKVPVGIDVSLDGAGRLKGSPSDMLFPLTTGNFNGTDADTKRRADFVYRDGIVASQVAPSNQLGSFPPSTLFYSHAAFNADALWTQAVIADLNVNGIPDVAAASGAGPDVQFFNGKGAGAFSLARISTSGPVQRMVVGDFDGDLVNDLGVATRRYDSTHIDVSIAWGQPFGVPNTPAPVGQFITVDQLITTPGRSVDSIAGVSNRGGAFFGFLSGSGDRQPLSSLALIDEQGDTQRTGTPNAIVAAHFQPTTPASVNDALVLSSATDLGTGALVPAAWLCKAEPSLPGNLTPVAPSGDLAASLGASLKGDAKRIKQLFATGDTVGDGAPEGIVAIGPNAQNAVSIYRLRASGAAPTNAELLLTQNGAGLSLDGRLTIVDIDHANGQDIVLLQGTFDGTAVDEAIVIYWNDGHGGFSADRSQKIALPGGSSELPRGFTIIDRGPAVPPRLVVVAAHKLYWAEVTPSSSPNLVEIIAGLTLDDATDVVAADVDGDGVADVAVADNLALKIFRQSSVLP